jgi:hypothetical protein
VKASPAIFSIMRQHVTQASVLLLPRAKSQAVSCQEALVEGIDRNRAAARKSQRRVSAHINSRHGDPTRIITRTRLSTSIAGLASG